MAGCGCKNKNNIKEIMKRCPLCHDKAHSISYPAVKMVVKEELKELVVAGVYYACDCKDCEVVFFDEDGEQIFLVIDVDFGADFKEVTKEGIKSCGGTCSPVCGG
ncbi:hypothetical protein [Alkaliphilus hydrothermalis]|uniref:SET domain-containing protein n=1 Tax=Alkaliphilus hydrothermalis TaxID=1482730 RepID=A0ABS2NQP5_9FIRM|nr:hypothetical protein [Alkaliphilus hydrothermalis]MBM7615253.1 SET domain-containing protein [Alkaliphilus hydrothermalis]